MTNTNGASRRGFVIKLSPRVDGELIAWLDQQGNAQATIKAALYAYMSHQPPQAAPLVQQLSETLARAEWLLTTLQCAPLQSAPAASESAVDTEFTNAVRGNMRPAFKPKR